MSSPPSRRRLRRIILAVPSSASSLRTVLRTSHRLPISAVLKTRSSRHQVRHCDEHLRSMVGCSSPGIPRAGYLDTKRCTQRIWEYCRCDRLELFQRHSHGSAGRSVPWTCANSPVTSRVPASAFGGVSLNVTRACLPPKYMSKTNTNELLLPLDVRPGHSSSRPLDHQPRAATNDREILTNRFVIHREPSVRSDSRSAACQEISRRSLYN